MQDLLDDLARSQDIQALIVVVLIVALVVTLIRHTDQLKALRRQVDELLNKEEQ